MVMFDWDRVFLSLQEYKLMKSWSNLRLDRQRLINFCAGETNWYTLYAPQAELALRGFDDIVKQQEILIRLLIDYTDRFYQALKAAYEGQYFEVTTMDEDHGSMLKLYQFEIDATTDDGLVWLQRLEELKTLVAAGDIVGARQWADGPLIAITFDKHLYYPLIAPADGHVLPLKMRPIAFDAPSEIEFVRDIEAFCVSEKGKEVLAGRSLYLLRNADSKNKGLGFATAGNFYPDFLLWIIDDSSGEQWLSLVDPKGIRNMDLSDPKLGLWSEIKKIERDLSDPKLKLSAFILSATSYGDLLNVGNAASKSDLEKRNVLFMDSGRDAYLTKLLTQQA
jgi:hypothetical protein